jgi:hypothetical protein
MNDEEIWAGIKIFGMRMQSVVESVYFVVSNNNIKIVVKGD